MYEVRLHGRGGQGTVLAAGMLAKALVAEGRHVVAVPQFGFERRGAPVAAYLRADEKPMRAMTNIYTPDCVVCIDSSLPRVVDIFAGLRSGGTLVQASTLAPQDIEVAPTVATVAVVDAVGIAREVFGRPITNTVMLGAFARATGLVSLEALDRALEQTSFRDGGLVQNRRALALGHARTVVHRIHRRAA